MGQPACLFFYGVRVELPRERRSLLEKHAHPLQTRARDGGLGAAWVDVEEKLYLFVGRKLAQLGVEGELAARYSEADLRAATEGVADKLKAADFPGEPTFWLRWMPGV